MLFQSSFAFGKSIVPPFEVFHAKNGAEIFYFTSAKLPLFQVELVFEGGSKSDPVGLSGLTYFAGAMARKGVEGLDENELASRIDDLAAGIEMSVGDNQFSVAAYGLNEHAKEILDLTFLQLEKPNFPLKPFERLKANHLDALKQLPDSPTSLAGHILNLIMFNGTEFARPETGLKADIERLKIADVKQRFPNLIRSENLKVLVIGGASRSEILDLVMPRIEAISRARPSVAYSGGTKVFDKRWTVPVGHVVVIDRPGIAEAHVQMGFIGPSRKVPEYHELMVADTVLGGHFGSRLNSVIREKLNLSYAIGGGFRFGWDNGSFSIGTSTQTQKIAKLLRAVNELLAKFVKDGPTEKELKTAQEYLTGSFPLGLQNVYAIADSFFEGRTNGLESDFMDSYSGHVRAVTRESVRDALSRHFKLQKMATVIVGDARLIGKILSKEKIKYVVRDVEKFL
jgi:zinc protease